MDALLVGIKYGLFLTLLVGPLVFAFVQAGVERGFRAGAMIGIGVWMSDLFFILSVYFGFTQIKAITEWPRFEITVGFAGGIILVIAGIFTLISKTPDINQTVKITGTYLALWFKGFLINTFNPFTVFFWIFVMTHEVVGKNYSEQQSFLFFLGILVTIILMDLSKVLLAKRIRHYLEMRHLVWIRRVTGVALIAFGIGLMIRVGLFSGISL